MKRVPTTLQQRGKYRPPKSRGYKHDVWAKAVKAKGDGCALAYLGGCDGGLEADHIVPLELGGTYDLENGRVLCRRHNRTRRRPKLKAVSFGH